MLDRLRASLATLVAQLFFIAGGVYLGNRAEAWKEARDHRQAARDAIENFRTELTENRDRLRRAAAVHRRYADSVAVVQRRGGPEPASVQEVLRLLGWQGLVPTSFGHTAWELAIATQSLAHVPRPLAFRLAHVYDAQRDLAELQADAGRALFSPQALGAASVTPWALTFIAYLEDATIQEPALLRGYDRILPALDSALAAMPR